MMMKWMVLAALLLGVASAQRDGHRNGHKQQRRRDRPAERRERRHERREDKRNTNQCEDAIAGSWLASRLWQNAPGTCALSPKQVVGIFEKGFAPQIRAEPGFQQYLGSVQLSDADRFARSYFYNVFETEEEARAANEEAVGFVAGSALARQIVNPSTDPSDGQFIGEIDFWTSTNCASTNTGNSGRYLATRLWQSTEVSGQAIVDIFREGFRDQIQEEPGFEMYMGVVVDKSTAYFMNVFDTAEGAANANQLAAEFIQNSRLDGRITLERATDNIIDFDFFDDGSSTGNSRRPHGNHGGRSTHGRK